MLDGLLLLGGDGARPRREHRHVGAREQRPRSSGTEVTTEPNAVGDRNLGTGAQLTDRRLEASRWLDEDPTPSPAAPLLAEVRDLLPEHPAAGE